MTQIKEAGWGIIFPEGANSSIEEALAPLLALRQSQAGDRFKVLTYQRGESRNSFLVRHGSTPSRNNPSWLDPEVGVPYFLLIVGDPTERKFFLESHLC